jgi:glycosyltransferase 2 family protein
MPASRLLGRPSARWFLRVLVSVGIIVYILVDVDSGDLLRGLLGVRIELVAVALALYLGGQVLSAYKWHLLGRSVGFAQPLLDYVRFYFIGMFFNLLGPSTIGGDVVRALYLGDGRRPGLALNSVLFDRASGLVLLMALGAGALLAFPQEEGLPWRLTAAIGGGGALLVLGWWMCPRLVRLLPKRNRLRRQVEDELAPFWQDRVLLAQAAAVSLVFHLTQVLIQWVLVRAAGARVPFSYCLIYHPVISLMIALPVSFGGVIGLGGYRYFLERINLDDSIAVTVGVLWLTVSVLAGLVGGAVFVASGAALPRVRARPPAEADVSAA